VIKNLKSYFEIRKKTIFVSLNLIAIEVELNQINALTFTGNPFLTSKFKITHIFFFSLKLRHFYLNQWILISGDSVVWLHFTKTFTNFGGKKKPNGFQVIAFCFKGSNKSCYVTHVNFSSSTLFKDIGKYFLVTSYISLLQNRSRFFILIPVISMVFLWD